MAAHLDAPLERVPPFDFARNWKIVGSHKANIDSSTAREFQSHHDIGNQEGMFKKEPTNRTILLTPADAARCANLGSQERCSFISETVNHVPGTSVSVVLDLRS